jgi:DNA-binding transcriptional ArsR family regulator
MRDDPDIASVAALIGDPSRAAMLGTLVEGRALPAGELAAAAGLSLSGASAQLARLTEGGLLTMERRPAPLLPAGGTARRQRPRGLGAARHEAAPPSCPFAGNRSAAACPHLL